MLKFDKDVLGVLKKLEKAGFETYATGDCIIEYVGGGSPLDWDLITTAGSREICELFPEAKAVDEAKGVYRLDFTFEKETEDGNRELLGSICDMTSMKGSIEEELSAHGFTIAAVADNPDRTLVDPYNGVADIRKRILRTIGNPDDLFQKDPQRMMQAMRYVSELGFDLTLELKEAIVRSWRRLLDMPPGPIRRELEMIMIGDHTGKALNMMADTGLMAVIFGEEVSRKMSAGEMQQFVELSEHIDETRPILLRRLGLLYTVLTEKRGLAAMERLEFDADTAEHLTWGIKEAVKVTFLANALELKRYIYENGYEKFNYVHNLLKAQRIVYDQPTLKIEARNHFLREIKRNNEPIFEEDLVIDANDIMEAGITDDPERAKLLLSQVLAKVHQDPRNNDRKYLLKTAKKYKRSKIRASGRYVHWIR